MDVGQASLEAALAAAVGRFDGASPVTPQIHDHAAVGRQPPPARPLLAATLAAAQAGGTDPATALGVAVAVELIAAAAAVHGEIAAGRPVRDGLAHGINAGDALAALAHLQLLDGTAPRPPEQTIALVRYLHAATYEVAGGTGAAALAAVAAAVGVPAAGRTGA